MNIKSLLIGSAAALVAVSGAQAADAIVAAEPEPLEYVRVCDAFGTGFFYIPGTETCLKIGGYVRFQTDFGRDKAGVSDWNSFTRATLTFDTRTDTELGALRGFVELRGDASHGDSRGVNVEQAFIELGGLKVGYFYSWWDDGLSGEADTLQTNALFNSIRYTYAADAFSFGVSVDELQGKNASFLRITGPGATDYAVESDNNVGVAANLAASFGAANFALLGGYDFDQEEGAIRAILTADVGPGTLGLAGVWASGVNAYYAESEWAIAAEYAVKVTDRLTITPGAQYYGNVALKGTGAEFLALGGLTDLTGTKTYYVSNDWTSDDAWKVGLTVDYKITDGLTSKVAVNYYDVDGGDDQWTGFVRLQRSF